MAHHCDVVLESGGLVDGVLVALRHGQRIDLGRFGLFALSARLVQDLGAGLVEGGVRCTVRVYVIAHFLSKKY